ncbi:GTA head formation protein, RCAP_rcc01685 family [Roseinatronobacter sp. NSM]|uniref:GTA head formation protein, RCAP_rcc01685 family n=1 Tax=Roseinatronobacter sp. NSM TaxID=3457785 RepID=UPI00403589E1
MSARRQTSGSRYLYDSFEAAQARIDAQERVFEVRKEALEFRMTRLESAVERLERRLWLAVYAVAAGVLLHGALALLAATQ